MFKIFKIYETILKFLKIICSVGKSLVVFYGETFDR